MPKNESEKKESSSKNPSNYIVKTKTSPLVAAELNCDEEEELLAEARQNTAKHNIIKQVHDSMDTLRNQLLTKGMHNYADDVDNINKNLKKQEELDRIKKEQELINAEKVNMLTN